jgi:antitoxin MazE
MSFKGTKILFLCFSNAYHRNTFVKEMCFCREKSLTTYIQRYTINTIWRTQLKTTTQVKMWGNSLAIRIPSRVALDLGLTCDTQIEITSDGSTATIKRDENQRISLEELVKGITPENIHSEVDWGEPTGNEIW